ncbi:hypothetical protein Tco_1375326 [Tanacetum coccineum]
MGSHTLQQLKRLSFDELKDLFETTIIRVQTFYLIESESDKTVPELTTRSSKRGAEVELDHEGSKKQKTNEASRSVQEQSEEKETKLSQEDLQQMMMVVLVEDVYVEALHVKYPIIDWEIYSEDTRRYWRIIRRLFEPDTDDILWKLQRYMHDPLTWRLYDTCGVHHVSTDRGHDIFMLVEKDYPLTRGLLTLMLCNKLQVDQYSEMADELLRKIVILANRPRQRSQATATTMGCLIFTTPIVHLGVKVKGAMSRIKSWDDVVVKVSSCLSKWKLKTLLIAIYGKDGALNSLSSLSKRSHWLDIIREVTVLFTKGIDLSDLIRKKVENRLNSLFWEDPWLDDLALKHKIPKLYALDNYKQITIVEKINHVFMVDTFRQPPRGGAEEEQFGFLLSRMDGLILINIPDRWVWLLEATGIDILTIVCPLCHAFVESSSHIFFCCLMARHLWRKLMRWWELEDINLASYNDWLLWLNSSQLSKWQKEIMEGVYYVKRPTLTGRLVDVVVGFVGDYRCCCDDELVVVVLKFQFYYVILELYTTFSTLEGKLRWRGRTWVFDLNKSDLCPSFIEGLTAKGLGPSRGGFLIR